MSAAFAPFRFFRPGHRHHVSANGRSGKLMDYNYRITAKSVLR